MSQNKIIKVITEHSYEIKILFDVLKESLSEANIVFVKDSEQKKSKKKNKKNKSRDPHDDEINAKKHKKNNESDDDYVDDDYDDSDSDNDNEYNSNYDENDNNENDDNENDDENTEDDEDGDGENNEDEDDEDDDDDDDDDEDDEDDDDEDDEDGDDNDDDNDDEDDEDDDDDDTDNKKKKSKRNKKQKQKQKEKQSKNLGGIRIVALDEHQTLMIYVKLNSSNFYEYYTKYSSFTVGLDLRELHKFIKSVDKDSIMTISVDQDDEQKIEFHLQNTVKFTDTHYKQKLMDIDDNSKRMPHETKFDMSVVMDTQDFRKICSEMSQFSEYIEIICTAKDITFKCLGDQNELVKTFKSGENGGVKILWVGKKPTIVQAIYNLKHLLTFGKCVNLCNDMILYLRNNYPLFIQYTVGNLGKMLVGLAPLDEKTIKQSNDYDDKTFDCKSTKKNHHKKAH
jgi:proliferating cell nuclear antigen PCNA